MTQKDIKNKIKYPKKSFSLMVSTVVITVFALLWNGFIHLVILKHENGLLASIHRPDYSDKMWISLLITVAIAFLFSLSYSKWEKTGSYTEAVCHSLFFAILMIVVVDLNQYAQYAIPFSLIVKWAEFGIVEFLMYGLIARKIFQRTTLHY